ncbi:glyceraldehyde 3-phosphate dehydrogenase [Mycoplasmoides fastidiosum]|uniref:Glyceraldehyde-3-phosphate dehydrogenase n=1 Tax=Mycoplasmoides fastidiosum TaxID=92758 RepID=A0ABU0LZJ1_9BACT|nr:type I glyceraldehyde-3-phosphate dehydrogenase [Mycoplasmoides fastidiosum]MDQ0514122.1 glyceraldehyde 3-phosphate dehydrogenase [Mycoplasmoides fastidiosum]UUD37470.1 type I glyceraldehyde-3-phosphate dehydrogenase [Mycoplasmoides fastidiosum]
MNRKVAINGFGRIGRLAFRTLLEKKGVDVVAINDLTDAKTLAHLLKYDSAQGQLKGYDVKAEDGFLKVSDLKSGQTLSIPVHAERDPKNLPWEKLGVDIVLECTGFFTKKEAAEQHLQAGAKRVLISAPGTGEMKTVVYNVNHEILKPEDQIVSAASCTTNALAPVVHFIDKAFTIKSGTMTTVHAYTADQRLQDAPHSDLRRARAAAASIVPTTTGAAKAIGLVVPSLVGKLDGFAHRVPVIAGSLVDLTLFVEKPVTVEQLNAEMKKNANESFAYSDAPLVSADIIGNTAGSIFDSLLTKVQPTGEVRLFTWYDNETSYVNQLVRTLIHMANL